jgi:immunoglobulin-like protein involved in spore germination
MRLASILLGAVLMTAAAACGGGSQGASAVCNNGDGGLDDKAFVFVEAPRSGERVVDGFHVSGCSSTFEANVNWRLRGRDGQVLASGFTQGGSLDPGPYEFTVSYPIGERQVGHLEVYEPRVTTEGFPPVKNVLPLVLEP